MDLAYLGGGLKRYMSSSAESSSAAQPAPPPAAVLKGHRDTLRALVALPADHPRRSRLASGSSDGTIRLWDPVAGGEAKAVLRGHSGGVYALTCFHLPTGGLYMVSGAFDNTLRLWAAFFHHENVVRFFLPTRAILI